MSWRGLHIGLVGPLPPPWGGMANQTRDLAELLRVEGATVMLVQTNRPYRPAWVGWLRGLRAVFRLVPYLVTAWRATGKADVLHVMANSGWSWHMFAAPAIWVAKLRSVPVIVNYRGGGAESFFSRAPRLVHRTLAAADALITPSRFLQKVFSDLGFEPRVIPNIVDVERFRATASRRGAQTPNILVARNLEAIYDIATAVRAFKDVQTQFPKATLTVAGSGPELARLRRLAEALGVAEAVSFAGRVDNAAMPELYEKATVALNPSRVDNMPISILEAFASGVPVVSTDVGGVPHIAENGRTALLVAPGDSTAMAEAVLRLLSDQELADRLAVAGQEEAGRYGWPRLRQQWLAEYLAIAKAKQTMESVL